MELVEGSIVAHRYTVQAFLGAGGMAEVHSVRDTETRGLWALKVLKTQLATDPAAIARFKAEHRAMANLSHPAIPHVHELVQLPDGRWAFAMALVEGEPATESPGGPAAIKALLAQWLGALAHVHARGMVHGDVKGENLMLQPGGQAWLMDFGLTTPAGARPGGLEGTLSHLAPERIRGGRADARADLYAVGVALFRWLAGAFPFPGPDPASQLRGHLEQAPPSLPSTADAALGAVALRLLAKRPSDRFQSAAEVLDALGLDVPEEARLAVPLEAPLLGREEALGLAQAALAEAAGGRRPLPVALVGPSGHGRTRALEEALSQARLQDLLVASCQGLADAAPLAPMVALALELAGPLGQEAPQKAEALRLAAAGVEGHRGEEGPDPANALKAALVQALETAASRRGVAIGFDDVEALDGPSQGLLAALITASARLPIAWLSAGSAAPAPSWQVAELGPLGSAELSRLVESALGGTPMVTEALEALQGASEGVPKVAMELLRHLLAHKSLERRHAGFALREGASALPAGLEGRYAARLEGLDEQARGLAKALAAAGAPCPVGALALAAEANPVAAETALGRLAVAGLARELSPSWWRLSDPGFGNWLAAQMGEAVAVDLRGALAEALAPQAGPEGPLEQLTLRARLGLQGHEPKAHLEAAVVAARRLVALKAMSEAKRLAALASPHAEALAPEQRLELLEAQATALRGSDEATAALAVAEAAVALAETLGRPIWQARARNGLGKIHQLASRYDEAKEAFEAAAAAAGEEAPMELARAHRALTRLAVFRGDLDTAYSHGRQALRLVRRHAPPYERAMALAEVGETFQGDESRLQEGVACLEEALALASELGDPTLEAIAAAGMGNLQLALGALAGARNSFERAAGLYEAIGNAGEGLFARLNQAIVAEEQGRLPEALQLAQAVATNARALDRKFPLAAALGIEGAALIRSGRNHEGLARFDEAIAICEAIKHRYLRAYLRQHIAPVLLLVGLVPQALAEAEALATFGQEAGVPEMVQRAALIRAEAAQLGGPEAPGALDEALGATHALVRLEAQLLRARQAIAWKDEASAYQALHAARSLLPEVGGPRLEATLLRLEAELDAVDGEGGALTANQAVELLESVQARHELVFALYVQAKVGHAKTRAGARARARELLRSLAAPLDPEQRQAYLGTFGREALLAEEGPAPGADKGLIGHPNAPTDLPSLQALAAQLAAGLAAYQEGPSAPSIPAEGAARRLAQIVAFATAVNGELEVEAVLDRALALTLEIVGAERGMILLAEGGPVAGLTSARYATAPDAEEAPGSEQYSRTVARTVMETGESVCVMDALSDPRFSDAASVMGLNLQTIVCVPLLDQGQALGAIYVDRQGLADAFGPGDLELVQALASMTAVAVVNARLVKAQAERQVHLEMLNRLARNLSRTLELEKVLDFIAEITMEVTKAERTLVLLWDQEELSFGGGRDRDGELPPSVMKDISRSVCRKVIDTHQPVLVVDALSDEEFAAKKSVLNLKLTSVIAVPLLGQGGLTGLLYVDSRARVPSAMEREQAVLQAIANTAALAVDNARLFHQATIDGLTGLYVRSFFNMRLEEEIRRTRRFGGRFSLLVMDIDHFKRFNDTYGHAVGDNVLRLVARTLRDGMRSGLDLACRYGGEEMVVLLPETDAEGALISAERIRRDIEQAGLPGPDGVVLKVTISIGVATFPNQASGAAELFERADQALYKSKHRGRNRVTMYEAEDTTVQS